MKNWRPDHLRAANTSLRVSKKLMDLANATMTLETHPALPAMLVDLAAQLRRALRPRRRIQARDRRAA